MNRWPTVTILALLATYAGLVASPLSAANSTQIIAVSGAPSPIPGENYSLSIQSPPSLNDLGQLAFRSANGNRIYRGNPSGAELIARGAKSFNGIIQPGELFDGGTKRFDFAASWIGINSSGQMATNLKWSLPTNANFERDAMVLLDSGSIINIASDDTPEPTGDGSIFISSTNFNVWPRWFPALNSSGQIAFSSELGSTSGGSSDNSAIYRSETAGGLTEIVRKGDAIPGGGGFFQGLSSTPVMNDAGQVPFVASIGGSGMSGDQAIYLGDGTSITEVRRKGNPTPNFASTNRTFVSFGRPSINNSGQVAFISGLSGFGTAGVYLANGGTISTIAEWGSSVPDFNGWFKNGMAGLEVNDRGQTVFRAEVQSAASPSSNPLGIFLGGTSEDPARKIAIFGEPAPNGLGTFTFISSSRYALNDNGQVAYGTWIDTLPGENGGEIKGLFLDSGTEGVETIALEGMPLLGSFIEDLSFAGTLTSGLGLTDEYQGLNNRGEVAFSFKLTDGREGMALWTSETIVAGDFDADGDVDGADFLAWQRGFGSIYDATDLSAWETNFGANEGELDGDFDSDGDVDGIDFLEWQRNDGTAANLALWEDNFGAVSNPGLAAASTSVPEPSTLLLAALGLVGIGYRRHRKKLYI